MKTPSWALLIGTTVLFAGTIVGVLSVKLGAFEKVSFNYEETGGYYTVGKEHLGAYHKISQIINEVEAWSKAAGDPCTEAFGEFFDDPQVVDEDRLHSRGGCIVTQQNIKTQALNGLLPPGYSTSTINQRRYLVAHFSGSPSIGPLKVYGPAMEILKKDSLKLDGAVIEIYKVKSDNSGETTYLFPVAN